MTEETVPEPGAPEGRRASQGARRYLGLDSSTQSLTAVMIDAAAGTVDTERTLRFDERLPHWKTVDGQLPESDPRLGHAPPMMWVEALDLLLQELSETIDLCSIRGIAISGQQHGSVYLDGTFERCLRNINARQPIWRQIEASLTRRTSPIWTDSSTTRECAEIRVRLGGVRACVELTGSDIFERFTGPQIRRFFNDERPGYEATASIALVSSFLTSILVGRIAPIDWGDGSGMNLMELRSRSYSLEALTATADDLEDRLPPLAAPWTALGPVAPYLPQRYGFAPECQVVIGSGDNPSSLVGVGAVEPGTAVISLGTSDTFFQLTREERTDPSGSSHLFVAPTGDAMALLCFRNGSLAREHIRRQFGLDWDDFTAALARTPPGNDGQLLVPWFEPEIVPRGAHGARVSGGLDLNDGRPESAASHCRAVVEGQILSMRLHSAFLGSAAQKLIVTGGGSMNPEIVQVIADVFQCQASVVETSSSAALGAAMRAAHALEPRGDETGAWQELSRSFCSPVSVTAPRPETSAVYDQRLEELEALVR